MASVGKIARRTFLFGAAALAGGAAFGYWSLSRPWDNPLSDGLGEGENTFSPWLKIAADNTITIFAPRAEMGQGVSTTLAALVAEELDVTLEQVKVEHGPASGAYYNSDMLAESGPFAFFNDGALANAMRSAMGGAGYALGLQGTGGSSSLRDGFDKMRKAGASARLMLLAAAAKRFGEPQSGLETADGKVTGKASAKSATYGELAADAAAMPVPAEPQLRSKADWKLLGKPQKRVDVMAKITGAPVFGIDVSLPGMLYGTVVMSPRFWSKPVSSDLSKAEKSPGVLRIIPLDTTYGHGFGILATSTWAAFKAAELIEAEWAEAEYPADSAAISKVLTDALNGPAGSAMRDDGNVDTAFADAPQDKVIAADYAVPYLAHACMEPMNASAQFKDGRLELWSPNQMPTITRQLCASALGIETKAVTVNTTLMGGGFGRRGEMDFSIYAALIAKEADGKPVKVTWTREEDMRHDAYRPAAQARFKARIGNDGLPLALDAKIATPSVIASVMRRTFPSLSPAGPERVLTEGAFDQPLNIANYRVSPALAPLTIPVGFWRSVGNSFNSFFHESFLDEIAAAGKTDPVALRLALMKDFPVAAAVVQKVADMSGWNSPAPVGTARGMAFCLSFGGWVAEVIQVSGTEKAVKIEKVWIAADVGTALDPGIIEAQLISGAIFGLSAAMMQEITFADGKVEQSSFPDYEALRISQCPAFEVAILENAPKMGGVGEIGTPPAAPALANAIFALTGKRIRSLPLSRDVAFA